MKAPACWISLLCLATVIAEDMPYGVEFVAGIRSGYLQKGLNLADDLIDLQFQSNITLNKSTTLTVAAWQGAEISGAFQEFGAQVGLTKDYKAFSLSAELSYYSFESTIMESGAEFMLGGDYYFSDYFSLYAGVGYHDGAESIVGQAGISGTQRLNDDSFLELKAELNVADSYFGRDGLYALTSRLSYTYNVNSTFSLTPFAAATIPLDDGSSDLSGGVWIEVFF